MRTPATLTKMSQRATRGDRHPMDVERTRDRIAGIAVLAPVVLSAVWSFAPAHDDAPRMDWTLDAVATPSSEEHAQELLRMDGFEHAVLWTPEPASEVVDEPPPAEPPRDLRLLGIALRDDDREATFYDAQTDRLVTLKAGEQLGSLTVLRITDTVVEFEERDRRGQLVLVEPPRSLRMEPR